MMTADLSTLELVAVMIDGVHFAEHLCVVTLGIGIDGTKHPLGVVEGPTENATVVTGLLAGLRDRGRTSPDRSWSSSTAPRRSPPRSEPCSTGQ
jgi:hypothetical protein